MIFVAGHFGTLYSYATVAGRIAEALSDAGLLGYAANLDSEWHPRWEHLRKVEQACTHAVVFAAPEHYITPFIEKFGRDRTAIFVSPNTYEMAPEHADTIARFGLIIAPSDFCMQTTLRSLDLNGMRKPDAASILPLGCPVSDDYVRSQRERGEVLNVLHFTSDQAWPSRKGTETLLAAWALLKPKAALKIHGPPALRRDALYRIADLGVDETVEYEPSPKLGTTDADLAKLYEWADLVVTPSRSEGYGMMIAGALAAGVPLLTTCNTGHGEFLETRPGCWLPIPTPHNAQMPYEYGQAPMICDHAVLASQLDLALRPEVIAWMEKTIASRHEDRWWLTWGAALPKWVERLKWWLEET